MTNDKAVLFIGANRPVPGRESEAKSLWLETPAWLDSQKSAGWFSRWDGFWLTAHGGDLNSGFVVWGDRAKIDEWRRTDAFEAWVFRANMVWTDVGVVPGVSWNAMRETYERQQRATGIK